MKITVRPIVCLLVAAAAACGSPDRSAPGAPQAAALRDVVLPDLSRMDPAVQEQVRQRYASMRETIARPGASDAERGVAYGELGILLHAGEYFEAAEPAYLNAQALMPRDLRWPYYLAHLHKSRGKTAESMAAFTRALELQPDDLPTLVWLGRAYLDQGQADKAAPLFERARQQAPRVTAVLVGLGQAALMQRDYARAVSTLEEALSVDPSAQSVHSPLAMAYRGLGDTAKAEAHLKQWKNTDVLVPDPLRQQLDLSLQSGLSYELRGVRALEARDFTAAAGFFKQGVDITPGTTPLGRSLRHKLATALYMTGDVPGAVKWFEETLRLAPDGGIDETAAKAHYSLGVLAASGGRGEEAITHLAAAVRFSPTYVEAHLALADALRRRGRVEQSLSSYDDALRLNPQAADARFGYGIALVRLGRYRQARDWFEDATRLHPDRIDFLHALARLQAAAPEDGIRDGARALAIVEGLLKQNKSFDLVETLAMALAEQGRFQEAVRVQRDVLQAARKAGLRGIARQAAANLARYEQRQPCRMPWSADDPIHSPGPPIDRAAVTSSLPRGSR